MRGQDGLGLRKRLFCWLEGKTQRRGRGQAGRREGGRAGKGWKQAARLGGPRGAGGTRLPPGIPYSASWC